MAHPFVPATFSVPLVYRTEEFTIRKLAPGDTEQDYMAVLRAKEHIRTHYSALHTNGWPDDTLTVEEDRHDLEVHEREFDERVAFAYTVFDAADKYCIGCLYIKSDEAADAVISLWTQDLAMDERLYRVVRAWIARDWPFQAVRYPVLEDLFGA